MHIIQIEDIPAEAIEECSGPGSADAAVAFWVEKLGFTVPADEARACLKGYGAWDAEELADDAQNVQRVFWLACGDFAEWDGTDSSPSGSDIFVLE